MSNETTFPNLVLGIAVEGDDYPGAVIRGMAAAPREDAFFIFSFEPEVIAKLQTFGAPTEFEPYGNVYQTRSVSVDPPAEGEVAFASLICAPADELEDRCLLAASEEWTGRRATPVMLLTVRKPAAMTDQLKSRALAARRLWQE